MEKFENRKKAKALANEVLRFVNSYDCDEEAFAETICQGHKTLQQSTMRLFIVTIRRMAEVTPDGRNEAAVQLAKQIAAISENVSLPLV